MLFLVRRKSFFLPNSSVSKYLLNDYKLLDSGDFEKLEQIGPYRFIRPSPQAVWRKIPGSHDWTDYDGKFTRHSGGGGQWQFPNKAKKLPSDFKITISGIRFLIQPTDFGHLGIFPEQYKNWQEFPKIIKSRLKKSPSPFKVLNLFAYTGGASLSCALAGAEVCHVDASKTTVSWARKNSDLNSKNLKIRWIIDDVKKFVQREINRGNRYEGIILDPPSFGRGTKGEVWKIETDMNLLMESIKSLLSNDYSFVSLSSHSNGYTPESLKNILTSYLDTKDKVLNAEEMLIPESMGLRSLPSGATCLLKSL